MFQRVGVALSFLMSMSAVADADPKFISGSIPPTFPPSCLDFPAPKPTAGEPQLTDTLTLRTVDGGSDDWRVTLYRRPCENGRAAALLDFTDLTPGVPASPALYPDEIGIIQGTIGLTPRLMHDPRSRIALPVPRTVIPAGSPPLVVQTEPYLINNSTRSFLPHEPFRLILGNLGLDGVTFEIGPYFIAQYPDANQALLIDGYVSGSYYDAEHAGEGILFEVGEANDQPFVFFAWFTYDAAGRPYWLTGNTTVTKAARTVTVPTLLLEGGGFAGAFGASVPSTPWGNVTFTFTDCNTVRIDYQSTHALAGRPTGSGTRTWTRLTTLNGLRCR